MRLVILALMLSLAAVTTAHSATNPDAIAVIIGNKNYRGIPSVEFADRDAQAMKRYVIDILGFSERNVIFEADVTYGGMIRLFDMAPGHRGQLSRWMIPNPAKRDVFVYYSGHGFPGLGDHKAYLLPVDADPKGAEATGYSLDLLKDNLNALGARSVTLVLDACFSGASGGGVLMRDKSVLIRSADPVSPAPNMTILAASGADETANWDRQDRHGLFTEYFLRAVYGAADAPAYGGKNTGRISASMVKAYLDIEMSQVAAREMDSEQTASLSGTTDTVLALLAPGQPPTRPDAPASPTPAAPPIAPVVVPPPPRASDPTECDRLAQPPRSYLGRVPARADGVPADHVNGAEALAACDAAIRQFPEEGRFKAFRGRALDRLGREAESLAAYRLAADQGNAVAQNNVGVMYATGRGVAKDEREAARFFKMAADQGYASAQANLAVIYGTDHVFPKDDREAARLYRLAADQGYEAAQYNLGVYYATGRGVVKDEREAARLYRLAADQGYAAAQANLGGLYQRGAGVDKDEREAARLYRLAADQGNAPARTNLGRLYESGLGVAKDEREAARLYRLAADQGEPSAQAYLADFYERGAGGVVKDMTEAVRLYQLSAKQGNEYATTALRRLGRL